MTKTMTTTKTKTQKKCLLLNNHKRTQIQRQRQRQRQRKGTEKVPATPDIVTPCFPLGDHLATTLSFRMCSPYPISSSDTHQHPIGHLWNICESQSHRHHHILIISWLSSKCSKGKPIIFSSWKRSLGKAWRFYRPSTGGLSLLSEYWACQKNKSNHERSFFAS